MSYRQKITENCRYQ